MKNEKMSVAVSANFDEMIQAIAIRAAVYVGERGWKFSEEWDGNDFTCTHLLAHVDGEPAGTLRIRYFNGFAKVERLAVLPAFRQKRYGRRGVAFELGDYAIEFLQRKGYRHLYGHALEELVKFWTKIARGVIAPMENGTFMCGDKAVVAVFGELPEPKNPITIESGHMVLVRPEGKWDEPGYWETQPAPGGVR